MKNLNGTYYLNNTGTRFVVYENGKKQQVYILLNGKVITRTALLYENYGNFVRVYVSVKGKKIKTFNYCFDQNDIDGLRDVITGEYLSQ